jgi:hypothetical protein
MPARFALVTITLLSITTALTAQLPDGGSEEARRAQVIAKGDGIDITVGEVEEALAQQGPLTRLRYRTHEELRALVDSLVRNELLATEAKRRGYENDPAVRQTVKESAAQALVRLEVEDKITPQSIPADEVKRYYESHAAEFHRPAMRRGSVIVVDSVQEANELLALAAKADMRAYAELAKQRSKQQETKQQGGDLGYVTATDGDGPKLDPAIRSALFALKEVGATSQPFPLGAQSAIVRLTAERPERHTSLDDATPSIRAKLWREQRQKALDALVSTLRARDKPVVSAERAQRISFDDMEKRPSGFAPDPPALTVVGDAAVRP